MPPGNHRNNSKNADENQTGNWHTQEPERADDGLRCGRQRGRRSDSDVCRSLRSRANEFTRRNIVVRRSDADVIRGVPYMKVLSNLLLVEEAVIAATTSYSLSTFLNFPTAIFQARASLPGSSREI
jgi:hypothetical protein